MPDPVLFLFLDRIFMLFADALQVVIDGKDRGTVNLYSPDEKSQQKVFSFKNSKRGNHLVQLVCAKGTVSVDALIIK